MIKIESSYKNIIFIAILTLLLNSCTATFEKGEIVAEDFKNIKSISELQLKDGIYYLDSEPYNGLVKGSILNNLTNLLSSLSTGSNVQELSLLNKGIITNIKRYKSYNYNDLYTLEKHLVFQQKDDFEFKTIHHYSQEHIDSIEVLQSKKSDPSLILTRELKVYYPEPHQQVWKIFQFNKGELVLEEVYSLNDVVIERRMKNKTDKTVLNGEIKLLEKTESNGYIIKVLECLSGELVGTIKKFKDDELIEERAVDHGSFKKYYNDGTLAFETSISKGLKNGVVKEYYSNGDLWKSYAFKNDKMHGKFQAYYTNGVLGKEGKYDSGKRIGEFKEFYDSGKKWKITTYDSSGEWLSYRSWYTNGQIAEERKQSIEPEIVDYIKYYENGQIRIRTSYKRNEIHGRYENWEKNGKLYRDTYYVLGKDVLSHEAFERKDSMIWNYKISSTDSIVGKDTFKIVKSYYKNGNLSERYRIFNNHKTGKYERFYRNGQIDYCFHQTPQYKHGKYKAFHPDGSLRNEYYLFKGTKVDTKKMFDDLSLMEKDTLDNTISRLEMSNEFICTKEKCIAWYLPEVQFKFKYPSNVSISIAKQGEENDNYVSITAGTRKDIEEFTIGWVSGSISSYGDRILSEIESTIKSNYKTHSSYVGKGYFNGRKVHRLLIEYTISSGSWDEKGNWRMMVILIPLQDGNGVVLFMQAKDSHPTIKNFSDFGRKGVTGQIWQSFTPEI